LVELTFTYPKSKCLGPTNIFYKSAPLNSKYILLLSAWVYGTFLSFYVTILFGSGLKLSGSARIKGS
jgi:hypothetical protein